MKPREKRPARGLVFAATGSFVLALTACASDHQAAQASPAAHVISGQVTADDHATIEASDQRMFQNEQEVMSTPDAPTPSGAASAPAGGPSAPANPPAAP